MEDEYSMKNRIIIQNGRVVSPHDIITADVLIEGESIVGIVAPGSVEWANAQVFDATDKYVLPGLVDPHTHIQLDTGIYKTADNWEIGTKVAAYGGVTTVVDFATQFPGQTFEEALNYRLEESKPAYIDYSYHMMVTDPPADDDDYTDALAALRDMGVPSIKLYTTYRPNYYMDDAQLLRTFRAMPDDMIALIHCENDAIVTAATEKLIAEGKTGWQYHGQSRPAEAEVEATGRVIKLAHLVGANVYLVHCSYSETISHIIGHHDYRGVGTRSGSVVIETCPQYFTLNDDHYDSDRPENYILQPPLRSQLSMWAMDEHSHWINVIATDHCDYTLDQKQEFDTFVKTPGGLPGLETSLQLTFNNFRVEGETLADDADNRMKYIAAKMSANPSKIFGLYPKKGVLQVGSHADVVIYDPKPEVNIQQTNLHTIGGYSPYEGMTVQGRVETTISKGKVLVHDGAFFGEEGHGHFLKAAPFSRAIRLA